MKELRNEFKVKKQITNSNTLLKYAFTYESMNDVCLETKLLQVFTIGSRLPHRINVGTGAFFKASL